MLLPLYLLADQHYCRYRTKDCKVTVCSTTIPNTKIRPPLPQIWKNTSITTDKASSNCLYVPARTSTVIRLLPIAIVVA